MVVEALTQVFNWFDVAVFGLIWMYVWQGWEKGVYLTLSEAFSWILGWWAGLAFTRWLSAALVIYLGLNKGGSWMVGFVLVIIIVQQSVYGIFKWLFHRLPRQNYSRLGQIIFGVIPTLISGTLLAAFVVTTLLLLPFPFPLKTDISESWFGQQVIQQIGGSLRR